MAYSSIRRALGPRLGPYTVEVRQEAPIRRALKRLGLLDPQQPTDSKATTVRHDLPSAILNKNTENEDLFHIILALRLAQEITSDSISSYIPAFARLANSLAQHLNANYRATLDDIYAPNVTSIEDTVETPVDPGTPPVSTLNFAAVHRTLRIALENGLNVRIRYYTQGRAVVGWRTIQPAHVTQLHLAAFCMKTQKERLFRIERILEIEPIGEASAKVESDLKRRSIRRLHIKPSAFWNKHTEVMRNLARRSEEPGPTIFLEEDYDDLIAR